MPSDRPAAQPARRRYRAPREAGGMLIEPPASTALAALRTTRDRIENDFVTQLAPAARAELVQAALEYTARYLPIDEELRRVALRAQAGDAPLILSGHQPQLFHPGVWFKNFLAAKLANASGGLAIHFLADGDVAPPPQVRVPTGSLDEPRIVEIPFDQPGEAIPWEDLPVRDLAHFESFAARAGQAIEPFVAEPLLSEYWPRAVTATRGGCPLGRALARARHEIEHAWGVQTLEVPLGELCDGPAFRRLLLHMLTDLPRLAEIYNDEVANYRRQYKVRSRAHPVPDLVCEDEWIEVPFWVWAHTAPHRRRLFARRASGNSGEIELSDRGHWHARLPASADAALESLAALSASGVRIRPRALVTTLFARMFLSDLFIHGIGGGMYDQVTDGIVRRYFAVEPPPFLVATATLPLPIAAPPVTRDDLRRIDRVLRELTYDPQRHVGAASDPRVAELVAEKIRWISAAPPQSSPRERHQSIQRINAALQSAVEPLRRELLARRAEMVAALRRASLLGAREFSFVLHPAQYLRDYLLAISVATP